MQQGKDEAQTIPHSPAYTTSPAFSGNTDLADSIIHIYILFLFHINYDQEQISRH